MFNAFGELLIDAIRKAAERQAGGEERPAAPPPRLAPMRLQRISQPAPEKAPAAAPVMPPMGRTPAQARASAASPDPLALVFDVTAPPSPLLDAFRSPQGLIGGIIVAQVLGPPSALRPHTAPGDTL